MNEFLKIITLFDNDSDRTIEKLSNIYAKRNVLIKAIEGLFKDKLIENRLLENKIILIKPNWVLDNVRPSDELCMRTHNNFVLAVIEVVATQRPSKIIIADAPVQGANWGKIITPNFLSEILKIGEIHNILITVEDLRKITFNAKLNIKHEINKNENYTIFDLQKDSLLEPLSNKNNTFRISYYNPDRLKESHSPGTHKYCISNEFLNADIVISLPKVKTHQKAGITAALKNIVGINGDKDFLPHHRIGGSEMGGDCYPGKNIIRNLSEKARDKANRNIGNYKYKVWVLISYILWNILPVKKTHSLSASWHGNDTIWRMVLDLNKIAVYGKPDGTISDIPQRTVYSLCDGIIGGQGNGPLEPKPLSLGIISFTNDSALNDIAMSILMGYDWQKISLLKNSKNSTDLKIIHILLNTSIVKMDYLKNLSIKTLPPNGWEKYLL